MNLWHYLSKKLYHLFHGIKKLLIRSSTVNVLPQNEMNLSLNTSNSLKDTGKKKNNEGKHVNFSEMK